jgi:hypothetical protein
LVKVDRELLTRLDILGATEQELTMANRLMPRRPDRLALARSAEQVSAMLSTGYRKDGYGDPVDLLFVEKNRRGRRPISEMTLRDRVLFRALVNLLAESLPEHIVTRTPNEVFKRSPMHVDDVRYVSKTDVTSYYEYVDHERLEHELEGQTGEAPAIAVLMELLGRMMGRRVGLPQVHRSSDILGDTYIDPVRRRMRRAGYEVFTYSDDFRIASRSLAEARQALEACAREVRELGLTLNEAKTYTYTAPNYLVSLSVFSDAERQLFDESDGPAEDWRLLFTSNDYLEETQADESTEPHTLASSTAQPILDDDALTTAAVGEASAQSDAQTRAAQKAWRIWAEEDESEEKQSTIDAAISETLLGRALPILGRAGDEAPLSNISALLRFEPALTPQISAYISALGATGSAVRTRIRRTLDSLTEESSFSVWQKVWLAEAAGTIRPARRIPKHYQWLRDCVNDPSPALAATASAAVGKLIDEADPARKAALDRVGPAWRTLVLWGIAQSDLDAANAAAEDRLERLLLEELEE